MAADPQALRRALRYGNGFFGAGSSTTAQFAQQVHVLRTAMEERQQDPSTFQIAKRVYIVVDNDVTRARERVDAGLKQIYGSSSLNAVAVSGTPAACIEELHAVAEAGAVRLNPGSTRSSRRLSRWNGLPAKSLTRCKTIEAVYCRVASPEKNGCTR